MPKYRKNNNSDKVLLHIEKGQKKEKIKDNRPFRIDCESGLSGVFLIVEKGSLYIYSENENRYRKLERLFSSYYWREIFKHGVKYLLTPKQIIINLEPMAQSRPRFARCGSGVVAYEKKEMKIWRAECSKLIKEAFETEKLIESSIKIDATFYVKPPKYISSKKKYRRELEAEKIFCGKKPDIDNYLKALLDSMTEIVFKDDGQVVECKARKLYSLKPRIEFTIKEVLENE
ncbi:RusA-like Holliday junction resolvase [Streptococcus phage APCM01]|uniref:RusA-like Holliday junction resolvase n=1 Tax=Streptococcus phage APCM01 TaxID=1647391 RepID=UPI00067A6994|nr:RusA-like Holliday junction resolvase [Streptococcus phage APCM01]AKI28596.1 putative RusA holliday junction resolvase [Streptococcus phage APCM01]